jgi:hypothetical protein
MQAAPNTTSARTRPPGACSTSGCMKNSSSPKPIATRKTRTSMIQSRTERRGGRPSTASPRSAEGSSPGSSGPPSPSRVTRAGTLVTRAA